MFSFFLFYINTFFEKGGRTMVDLYVALIIAGRRTLNSVPARFQTAVKADLDAVGLTEEGNVKE